MAQGHSQKSLGPRWSTIQIYLSKNEAIEAVHGVHCHTKSACNKSAYASSMGILEEVVGRRAWDGFDMDPIGRRDGDGLAQLQIILFSLELKCEALVQADEGDLCLQSTMC